MRLRLFSLSSFFILSEVLVDKIWPFFGHDKRKGKASNREQTTGLPLMMKTEFYKAQSMLNQWSRCLDQLAQLRKKIEFLENNLERNLETISKQCSGADISKMYLLFILITLVLSSKRRHDIWNRRYAGRWRSSQMQMVGKGPEITIWLTLHIQSQLPKDA